MEDKNLTIAKKANELVEAAIAQIKASDYDEDIQQKDLARLQEIADGFKNAIEMEPAERESAFAAGWMVSMANNAAFLLWRRNIMTAEIEAAYRELPSTEAAMADYEAFMNAANEEAKNLEEQRRAFMDKEHSLDIFKAVLGGESREKAEEKLAQYQQAVAKSLGA